VGATLRRAGFAIATIAAVVACRQLVGIGDAPPMGADLVDSGAVDSGAGDTGADAVESGIVYAGVACEACLESKCGEQAKLCAESPPCSTLEGCLGQCGGDPTCRARCFQTDRVGSDPNAPAFEACMVRWCATPCGLVCGGVAEAANPDAATACQTCYQSQGCMAAVGCLSNPACTAYAFCAVESALPGSCAQMLDDGGVDASAFTSVAFSYCVNACEFDSDWSCVGHVEWPPAVTGEATIHLHVYDTTSFLPVAGVLAQVCNGNDPYCAKPSVRGTTLPDGTVTLVQQPDAGPVFTNDAYLDLSGGGTVPEMFFWSFPLSQSSTSFDVGTVTSMEAMVDYEQPVGVVQDLNLGFVAVNGFDCLPSIAGTGMTFALTAPGSPRAYYALSGVLDPQAVATDDTSTAVFFNVPIGSNFLAASAIPAGPIGQFGLFLRPGTVTLVYALPQPN
jgi:hypothetical protein